MACIQEIRIGLALDDRPPPRLRHRRLIHADSVIAPTGPATATTATRTTLPMPSKDIAPPYRPCVDQSAHDRPRVPVPRHVRPPTHRNRHRTSRPPPVPAAEAAPPASRRRDVRVAAGVVRRVDARHPIAVARRPRQARVEERGRCGLGDLGEVRASRALAALDPVSGHPDVVRRGRPRQAAPARELGADAARSVGAVGGVGVAAPTGQRDARASRSARCCRSLRG